MNLLVVPTRLDALIVTNEMPVCQPLADFSQLPYRKDGVSFNVNNVNLAETIVTQPFQDQGLWLQPGLHLGWSLPQSLLRGQAGKGGGSFPQLPNRWLVVRTDKDASSTGWVVESDYVWPEGSGTSATQISVPWVPDAAKGESLPFRFAGRTVPLASWAEEPAAERLPSLTAPGYGIADFVSFYPNSFSLFGLFDNSTAALTGGLDGSTYQVIGWYSDLSVDPVALWAATVGSSPLPAAMLSRFGWTLPAGYAGPLPQGMLVYGSLTMNTGGGLQPSIPAPSTLGVTVGNTATEALAAYLASEIDPANASTIEDQLDAFAVNQAGAAAGAGGFSAALHRQGFTARGHGTVWELATTSGATATPPAAQAAALSEINGLQAAYDDACAEIDSRRSNLFSDWYKYMVAKSPPDLVPQNYPDPDQIAFFITKRNLDPLRRLKDRSGSIALTVGPSNDYGSAVASGAPDSVAVRLATAIDALYSALSALEGTPWTLRRQGGNSYLSPAEPSLLLTGQAPARVGSSSAAAVDGVPCLVAAVDAVPVAGGAAESFLAGSVAALSAGLLAACDCQWSAQPWWPVALEWQAQILPLADGGVDPIKAGNFSPSYITGNFAFGDGPDLVLNATASVAAGEGAMIAGRSVLSGHVPATLAGRLTAYLTHNLLPLYFTAKEVPVAQQSDFDLMANLAAVTGWFEQAYGIATLTAAQQAANLEWTALRTLARLDSLAAISQRLTGSNAALLGYQQTVQLPIADPMGLPMNTAFTQQVGTEVGDRNRLAPQPNYTFLPLRAGSMEITRLRLVDRFGQSIDILQPKAMPAATLSSPVLPDAIYLPPRLPQASRLRSDWLGSRTGAPQGDGVPADSPICAWIIPNFLDNSLLVFDPAGVPLGAITEDPAQPWQTVPAAPQNSSTRSVPTAGMRKLAKSLVAYQLASQTGPASYLDGLLDVFEQCSPMLVPSAGGAVSSLPLMTGRPLAVARLRLDWQLDGVTAGDQGWNAFRLELQTMQHTTRGIDAMTLPITLGDPSRAANGIVGYWIETADGYQDDTFYAPLYPSMQPVPGNPQIQVPAAGATCWLPLSPGGGSVTLTVVIDPRAPVYIRSGLLPEQTLTLSPALYASVMNGFAVTLFTGPIVTPQSQLRLTLPACPGAVWNWYAMEAGLYSAEAPVPFTPNATYPGQRILREGWAQLTL